MRQDLQELEELQRQAAGFGGANPLALEVQVGSLKAPIAERSDEPEHGHLREARDESLSPQLPSASPVTTAPASRARSPASDDRDSARFNGSLIEIHRPDLLIIDDVGVGQVKKRDNEPTGAHTLYNIIDRRHGRVSTAVTSNIALSDWGRYLGDATITARRHPRPARVARDRHRRRRPQLPPARRHDSRRQARRQG
jgi:hypothetical protein